MISGGNFAPYDDPRELPEGATCQTPFGVPRTGYGYGQPVTHPLAGASLAEIDVIDDYGAV